MRSFGLWLGRVILGLGCLILAFLYLAPREPVDLTLHFDATRLTSDLDAYLMARESAFRDLVPGTQKRVIWAGEPGRKTDLAIVYLHGFAATSEEIRPVPDRVAKALGANLYFARLTGHGRGGPALAEARVSDWINDTAEALAIGAQIGERVIVIGSATGATLATLAANDPQLATGIDALVLLSPSYGASSRLAGGLALPMARRWAPLLVGETQEIVAQSPDHAKFWTLSYPTVAALPMAAAADAARGLNVEAISIPALLLYSETDRVVAPGAIREMARRWGGPVRIEPRVLGPDDDTNGHVLAGDILSPGQTDATITLICDWIQALG